MSSSTQKRDLPLDAKNQILARMYVMLTLLGILPFLIAGQVLRLGLVDGPDRRKKGENQSSTYVQIPALRGTIVDRNGRTLAVDVERYDMALDPTAQGFSAKANTYYEQLSRLTGRSITSVRRAVRTRTSPAYVLLARNVQMTEQAKSQAESIPGIRLEQSFSRFYNYATTASHILGHVDADQRGLAGIEKSYDAYLRGIPGKRAAQRDMGGRTKLIAGGAVVEPVHGESIVLTVDLVRQTILEEELARGVVEAGATWGTAIAMDPHTGEIMALANYPTYDSNHPGSFSNFQRRNHAITDRIEPGSTYKLVAAIASVETDIVSMQDSIDTTPGWIVRYGRTIRDTHPHGKITFEDVIALSSNVGFDMVTEKLSHGAFYQYARQLGFGQISGIDLPGEVGGRLKKPSSWSGTTLSAMSRGYEIDVTPLQVLSAYAAFANGGVLVRPYIVSERRDIMGKTVWRAPQDSIRRAFSKEVAAILLPAFEKVVNAGTAENAIVEGLTIAGKTGTAKKTRNGRYVDGLYRATFVGFYPSIDPEVAMIVIMDEPKSSIYGGSVSAPVFQRTSERWLGTLPSLSGRFALVDSASTDVIRAIPDVTGLPTGLAKRRLGRAGLGSWSVKRVAEMTRVASQTPDSGPWSGEPLEVTLRMEDTVDSLEFTMPDLKGLSAREALFWMDSHGIDVKIEGHGHVVKQSPLPGRLVTGGVVLNCR